MSPEEKQVDKKQLPVNKRKNALIFSGIFSVLILLIGLFFLYSSFYEQKIYPRIKIADIDVGGMEKNEAIELLSYKIESVKNQDIDLFYENENWIIDPSDFAVKYDLSESLDTAYNIGRNDSFISNIVNKIKLLFSDKTIGIAFSYDKAKFESLFTEIIDKIDKPSINANCEIINERVVITSEQIGQELQLDELKTNLIQIISQVKNNRKLILPVVKSDPKIKSDNIQLAKNQAEIMIGQDVNLLFEDKKIKLSQENLINWMEFIAFYDDKDSIYKLKTILNEEKIKFHISILANDINQKPKNARLTISDGRAAVFQISQNGYVLNQDQTVSLIVNTLTNQIAGISTDDTNFDSVKRDIDLPVDIIQPEISSDNIDNLGIKELIASGTTNFRKSPKNRRHNIKIGADIFHGALIKPDAVFSFNKVLGNVSAARGFLPELVIKQDKTEPEIGGGLCQVSTTMFRVALNAGLPITERKNHKYRVSYYEPPVGLDATVYTPSPDLKFKNNTSKHILIQSYISGSRITFEFYGTKDGRSVHISDPELYDHKNPPPTRYIEDENMEPGTEKYLERAHAGVKAKIFYQVKRNNEVIHEQTFYSKYVAWPAVIKRGPQKEEENQEENPEENKEEGGD